MWSPRGDNAFTFIEIVITLAVASILLGVATSAVITSLRAEQTVLWRDEANLVGDRMITATYLGTNPSNVISELDTSWVTENTAYTLSNLTWNVWNVYKKDRPAAGIRFALRSQ